MVIFYTRRLEKRIRNCRNIRNIGHVELNSTWNSHTLCIHGNVNTEPYPRLAVDNKLLIGLSAIGSQQASATQRTNEAIDQILDYCATYPSDGILYRSSDMVLCAHSDAGLHN